MLQKSNAPFSAKVLKSLVIRMIVLTGKWYFDCLSSNTMFLNLNYV